MVKLHGSGNLSMWSVAVSMSTPFMGTFKTKELMMSLGLIQLIGVAANGLRIVFSIPFGKYSDKKSYAKGIELAFIIASASFAINVFITKDTWWLMIPATFLYYISIAGTNANKFNIAYSYVDSKFLIQAMAIQNSISGIIGFMATLVGSMILSYIQKNGNVIFGINAYGQQVLSAISLVIAIAAIVYDRLVVEKQKRMIQ